MTDETTFTAIQTRQIHILRGAGFTLTILHRDEASQRLGVAGRDPSGARILGVIDAAGTFAADLIDFSPSVIAVSAPTEATIEEMIPWP